ncbi:tol-pal system-associated acyl-CoA thioesterase [Ancylobacter sp. SL191]|uniref:tol-pal system-associated acyl-CoA thioesterase n=1 Tax=Ancylobacter sp. SL191 TaxID=2995166 RepID=UPI00226ED35F|nr:tol-pal system-associated acyl-CoA thioesterase [Ancylobacter sp. SL191]WAC28928.1 tol-pal system-associated acyl-CoA thioesterase [Ancylobacter sp. SL191]
MNQRPDPFSPDVLKADPFLHLAGRLVPGGHVLPVRVYYEDTDFSGIVYHANYLKFMERARSDHLRLIGVVQGALFGAALEEAPGFAFVVRSMELQFVRPARIDDVLEIHTSPIEVAGASITLQQKVMRGTELLVEGKVKVAFVAQGRARRIPDALRAAMKAALGEAPEA